MFDRRAFLKAAAVLAVPGLLHGQKTDIPVTGKPDDQLSSLDSLMTEFLETNKVPGASLAIARQGKLLYARGFGFADLEEKKPVEPDALFRIASISKPFTAVAALKLAEQKKLKLDAPALEQFKLEPHLEADAKPDPRWKTITLRQCLRHTGGWDRAKSYDPIGIIDKIAKSLKQETPVPVDGVVRYMMGQPLDFDPGTRYAYSNLGYLVVGRAITAATGRQYDEFVRKEILAPVKAIRTQLGRVLPEDRAKGEVKYYDSKRRKAPCLYPPRRGMPVPLPDGAANFEAYEAHGGWISSTIDLVRFAGAFDVPDKCPLLSLDSIRQMGERPEGLPGHDDKGKPKPVFYGCGWNVRPTANDTASYWHSGLISGTSTMLIHRASGLNYAVLFNSEANPDGKILSGLIDGPLSTAIDKISSWPDRDLFAEFA